MFEQIQLGRKTFLHDDDFIDLIEVGSSLSKVLVLHLRSDRNHVCL